MNIILGSQSPRRKQLLETLFPHNIKIIVSELDEIAPDEYPIFDIPEYLATQKAIDIVKHNELMDSVLITADTLVFLNNTILGKPRDKKEAIEMLTSLSGTVHEVITGVCIYKNSKYYSFKEITKVHFNTLLKNEIEFYVDNFNPLDKAGSYGIQEYIGYIAVKKIEGCFYNVMGLPISRLYAELKSIEKL